MSDLEIPDIVAVLTPAILMVPEPARPSLLALLERGAAGRYRKWAGERTESASEFEACAAREEQIADTVDRLFPLDTAHKADIEKALPVARDAFFGLFEGLPLEDQWRVQAAAERQGAIAWRGVAAQQQDAALQSALEGCARLEEESAETLERLTST